MNPKIRDIDPGWSYDDMLPFTPACQVGDTIYVAGQCPIAEDGQTVGVGDIRAQVRQCITNIQTVLAKAGAGLDDVVKLNVYLTDRAFYRPQIEVRKEMFKHLPAATVVTVAALGLPEWLVEIDAVAVKP